MEKVNKQLVLRQDDYDIIIAYLKGGLGRKSFDRVNAQQLEAELKKAKLVTKEQFPEDVVRLNSKVVVKDEASNKVMEVTLVTPEKSSISEGKISFMAPIGTALIGFRQGERIRWQVPAGKKTFTIIEVHNDRD